MRRLYTGGTIHPLTETAEHAEALLTDGACIADVGRADRLAAEAPDAERVDLGGRTLLPGFIDCHMHPVPYAFARNNVDLNPAQTPDEALDLLRDRARETPPGGWVLGLRLDEEQFAEPALPTRDLLDAACPAHPVLCFRYCGHVALANSRALAIAGVTADTPDPFGGVFDRDPAGELTGVLRETAIGAVSRHIAPNDPQEILAWITAGFEELARLGLTTVCGIADYGEEPKGGVGAIEVTFLEALAGRVQTRVNLLLVTDDLDAALELRSRPAFAGTGGDYRYKVGGMKFFSDGTLGGHTAVLYDPYTDDPSTAGLLRIEEEKWREVFPAAVDAGFQVATHAIGDRMNDLILDLYEHALSRGATDGRMFRVEHASVLTPKAVARFAELGITASVQPPFITSEVGWLEKRLGPERARQTYPFRQLLDAGVHLCGGSDCPVELPNPLWGMQSAVTRGGFQTQECLTRLEAVQLYTSRAAEALGEGDMKGTLAPGKLADLVILDGDPLACEAEVIGQIAVTDTIIGGEPACPV